MLTIQKNTDSDFTSIIKLANMIWPVAYGSILSKAQLDYMLKLMYSVSALQKQANENKHEFIIAYNHEIPVGFASFEVNYKGISKSKLHKLYVLTEQQGSGIGKKMLEYIETEIKNKGQNAIILNVNRFNSAQYFYEKLGFSIQYEENIDIGNGYLMEDYVMEKTVMP